MQQAGRRPDCSRGKLAGVLTTVALALAFALGWPESESNAAPRRAPAKAEAVADGGKAAKVERAGGRDTIPERLWSESQPAETGLNNDTPVTMGAFSRLAKVLSPAVVNVAVTRLRHDAVLPPESNGGPVSTGAGTGFFIHEDGWILTNHHVVEEAVRITVRTADDRTFEARIAGADPATDLALLKVNDGGPFPIAPLGDSDALEIGEWVVAIGNPYGLGHTVTAGIVSAKGRSTIQPGQTRYASYIQTDASINPGNSGGPLVNIHGQVVGINAAVLGKGQGIGFAIPSNMAKKAAAQLARGRIERSWFGISVGEVTPQVARALRLDRAAGALVREVIGGSPADKAQIRAGDVILRFGDHEIRNANDLPWLAASSGSGTKIRVEGVRDGSPFNVHVTLVPMPKQFGGLADADPAPSRVGASSPAAPTAPASPDRDVPGLGMRVTSVTPELQARFGLRAPNGALVVQVDAGGPADLVGIRTGDVVLQVERRAIRTAEDLVGASDWFRDADMVPLYIARGRQAVFVTPKKGR